MDITSSVMANSNRCQRPVVIHPLIIEVADDRCIALIKMIEHNFLTADGGGIMILAAAADFFLATVDFLKDMMAWGVAWGTSSWK